MDARRPCPDSALLAAFLDGTLADYERRAVVTHLAECPQCRAVALTVVEFHEVQALDELWEPEPTTAPPAPLVEQRSARWSREKTRAPALAAAVVVAATVAASIFLIPPRSAERAVSALIDAAEGHRGFEARVSGFAYAPPPNQVRSTSPNSAPYGLVTVASRVRDTYDTDYTVPSRRAAGVAALLIGELDDAITSLEIAVAAEPRDAGLVNDLAAAYFERAQRANRPDDLPAALSAVERALQLNESMLEPWFNRALIITALGLRDEARRAWDAYIGRDPASPWSREARQRRARLGSGDATREWLALRTALEQGVTAPLAETAVTDFATRTRDYIENDLLRRWIEAARAGDSKAAEILVRIRLIGEAFARHGGDTMYVDFADSAVRAHAAGEDVRRQSADAHGEFLEAMEVIGQARFADASAVLLPLAKRLDAVHSPFAARARIDHAATEYYALQYEAAARRLLAVRADSERRGHAMLVIRAAWLQGLTAFALNEFAAAQVHYEEMLAASATTRDGDQWVMANVLLANLHEMLGDATEAWRYRVAAFAELHTVLSVSTRAALLGSASGDAQLAEHHAAALLLQSVLSSTAGVPPSIEVQVRAQRARSLFELGRLSEANAEIAAARNELVAVADSQGRSRVEVDVLLTEAELLLSREPTAAAQAAARALNLPLVERDHLRRARLHLQLARAALAEGGLDKAEQAVSRGIEALESVWLQPSAEFAVRASDPVWALYDTAAQVALKRGDVPKAFVYSERGRVRTSQERRAWGSQLVDLEDIQRALAPDTALLVLSQLDDRLQIWVVRDGDVATHSAPFSRARATALIAAHLREMARGTSSPAQTATLFDAVVQPAGDLLATAQNLVIVADAPYNRIAFAGLWDRRRNEYLVENHGVVLAPSATAFAWSLERSRSAAGRSGVRQASIIGARKATPANVSLADRVSAAYGPQQVKRAAAATPSDFADDVTSHDVVHVSAQLIVSEQYPSLSRFVMADEAGQKYSGAAFARSWPEAARVRAQVVSFESGAGPSAAKRADSNLGMARTLIAAGVPSVVGASGGADEPIASEALVEFHRHFAAGAGAAESLRRAQLAALSESDRRLGPWAALTVFGSTQ